MKTEADNVIANLIILALCVALAAPVAGNPRNLRSLKPEPAPEQPTLLQPLFFIGDSLAPGYNPGRDGNDGFWVRIEADEQAAITANNGPGQYYTEYPIHVVIEAANPNWRLECRMNPLVLQGDGAQVSTDRLWIRNDGLDRGFVPLTDPVIIAQGQQMPHGGTLELTMRVLTTAEDQAGSYQGLLQFAAYLPR